MSRTKQLDRQSDKFCPRINAKQQSSIPVSPKNRAFFTRAATFMFPMANNGDDRGMARISAGWHRSVGFRGLFLFSQHKNGT